VNEDVVFDSSAILTFTGNEPGTDEVQAHLLDAIAGQTRLHASFVTLTEIEYISLQEEGETVARQRLAELYALPIQWVHSDQALCSDAAKLKAVHRISFADSFVAATARRLNAILVHKDPEFQLLAGIVKQKMLPPK
jgi:predicted nucleic acid-binding protein